LSLDPELVNSRFVQSDLSVGMLVTASVKSVEDHGYVLSTGIEGVASGFLPHSKANDYLKAHFPHMTQLRVGQVIEAAITKMSEDQRTIKVTLNPAVVSASVLSDPLSSIASLQPGQLAEATLTGVFESGVTLRLFGFFEASVDAIHLPDRGVTPLVELQKRYKIGEKVLVRVIFVSLTTAAKIVSAAAMPHVLSLTTLPEYEQYQLENTGVGNLGGRPEIPWPVPFGTQIQDGIVKRVDPRLGLLLEVPSIDSLHASVHISRVSDKKDISISPISGRYKLGTRHRYRVVGYDAFDGILQASMQASILDEPYLRAADLSVGEVALGTVDKVLEDGLLVSLSPHVTGFVPRDHASDAKLKDLSKKFSEGDQVKCRVWGVRAADNRAYFTCKRSIVGSDLAPIYGYTEAEGTRVGAQGVGIVVGFTSGGALISMFQNRKAFVPMAEISDAYINAPQEALKPGQTVKFRVLSVDSEAKRMRVSLRHGPGTAGGEAPARTGSLGYIEFNQSTDGIEAGQLVRGRVVKISRNNKVVIALEPSNIQALLDPSHLCDNMGALPERVLSLLKPGFVFEELVVLSKIKSFAGVNVTAKPALLKATKAGRFPKSTEEIEPGQILAGYVHSAVAFGVFVSFAGDMVGMAPIQSLSDQYVASPSDLFQASQTVLAFVTGISDEGKIELSLKRSVATVEGSGFLSEKDFVYEYFMPFCGALEDQKVVKARLAFDTRIGTVEAISVKQKMPYGWMVEPANRPDGDLTTGFVTLEQTKGAGKDDEDDDARIPAFVLDVDADKKIIDYSIQPKLVSTGWAAPGIASSDADPSEDKKKKKRQQKASAKIAQAREKLVQVAKKQAVVDAVIELVKQDYLVLAVPSCGNAVVFAATKSYNLRSKPFMRYKAGQTISGSIAWIGDLEPGSRCSRTLFVIKSVDSTLTTAAKTGKRAVNEPIDPSIQFFEDYQPGVITKARVQSVKSSQANLELAKNVKGRLHVTELVDSIDNFADKGDLTNPFKAANIKVNAEIRVKVIGLHSAKTHSYLPITRHTSPNKSVINVTIRPSELAVGSGETEPQQLIQSKERTRTAGDVKVGQKFVGFVDSADIKEGVWVLLNATLRGRIMPFNITRSYAIMSNLSKHFPRGAAIEVQVERVVPEKGIIDLVLVDLDKYPPPIRSIDDVKEGEIVAGKAQPLGPKSMALLVQVGIEGRKDGGSEAQQRPSHIRGRVTLTDISDKYEAEPLRNFQKHQLIPAYVVRVDKGQGQLDLSLRPSLTSQSGVSDIADPDFKHALELVVDQVVHGYIKSVTDKGCFVQLSRSLTGRVKISELSDEFIRDIKSAFEQGQLVAAAVIGVDKERNQVELSLRKSRLGDIEVNGSKRLRRLEEIIVGEIFTGTVARTESYGVLIKLDSAHVTGLCPLHEMADSQDAASINPHSIYEKGDRVLVKVLEVDTDKMRVKLGLKASYFTSSDTNGEEKGEHEDASEDDEGNAPTTEDDDEDDDDDDEEEGDDSEEEEERQYDSDIDAMQVEDEEDVVEGPPDRGISALPVKFGFQWGDDYDSDKDSSHELMSVADHGSDSESSGESDNDRNGGSEGKDRRKKKSKRQQTKDVTADILEETPKSAADFERLLIGSPNSSYLWINYMAFYLQLSEVDQARSIAEKALKTISFREEREKMNVWVALLNLERKFGTKTSLEDVFKRSIEYMEAEEMYLKLAKIYERNEQSKEAEDTYKTAVRKFGESPKVWVQFALFYLRHADKGIKARELLQRALKSLPKHKHVQTIVQFAQIEFQHGEPERGRTIFEGILSTYPKRNDIWLVYISMEINLVTKYFPDRYAGDEGRWDAARKLFQRATVMKFSSKKMKSLFKQWLQFEKAHGDEEHVEAVKARALEYVQSQQ
ncbi:rRNA biogenesis protein rrp5, partial [Spiromyces aspiralis]